MTAKSLSGNVQATDIRGDLSLETMSGNVQIVNAARVTKAKTTSGNVELTNIDSDGALDAGTMSGNVIVATGESAPHGARDGQRQRDRRTTSRPSGSAPSR